MNKVKIEKIMLTPQIAKDLLAANLRNRALRPRAVQNLAEAIRRGEWIFDGSPIRISADNVLLDGQHRCAAVVEADTEVETMMITGLPEDAQLVMDSGRSRRFADYLKIVGVADYNSAAACCRLLWNYNKGVLGWRGDWKRRPEPSYQQLLDYHSQYGDLIDIGLTQARRLRREVTVNRTSAAVAYLLLAFVDNDDADDFFEKFRSGTNLDERDPILALRRLLFNRERKMAMSAEYQLAVIIKAWNFYRAGVPIQQLMYRPGGRAPEPFPEPR